MPSVGAQLGAAAGLIPAGRTRPEVDADFGKLPVCFVPNRGQMDERVAYYVQGKDKSLYFSPDGLTIALTAQPQAGAGPRRWAVKLDFVGASGTAGPVGENETGAMVSYFKGKPENWKAGLPTYSKIVYRDLWPGIDLVYQGTVNRLKYEFVVRPGADPSRIRLAYRGVEGLSVDEAGRLNVTTPLGGFQDDIPVAYQETDGKRTDIALAYEIDARAARHLEGTANPGQAAPVSREYGFEVGEYDRTRPLVLDPAFLVYCGYVGGSGGLWDAGAAIAVDGPGSAYITGSAYSAEDSFPVTAGPDLTHNGYEDAFVAKLNPSGTALDYCGYIGGPYRDYGGGIVVDAAGNAYLTGGTTSGESFPTLLGPDVSENGQTEAFVAKVNPAGTELVYCGFIGGAGNDEGNGIALDASGNAYVTGVTYSDESTFPVTAGPDLTFNGQTFFAEPFVAKVNAAGTGLVYCGYVGGTGTDIGRSIAVDVSGNAYLTGETYTHDGSFPALVGPDLTPNGSADAFVAKVNAAGTALVYCGYLGGSGEDSGNGIAVDLLGNAYVAGKAWSTEATFPVTAGPDLTGNGASDAFVAKINPTGTGLVYCGYIGGSAQDFASGIAVDASGGVYVAGETASDAASFPAAVGPDSTYNGGHSDAFVAKINPTGTGLVYCGYIGGAGYDSGCGIAVARAGKVVITGRTDSRETSFPVTAGPDLTFNGYGDAFVAKIAYREDYKHAVGDVDGDGKDEVAVDFGTLGIWLFDQGNWSQITPENPESLLADRIDPHDQGDILAGLGSLGLWMWRGGAWSQLSQAHAEGLAAGIVPLGEDNVGKRNLIVDFGGLGLWFWPAYVGIWHPLAGANADQVITAKLGAYHLDWIIGDFGPLGLWAWDNSTWSQRWIQLSGVNPVLMIKGRWAGGERLVADFGSLGLWSYTAAEGWAELTAVNADLVMAADTNGDGNDEIVGDFGLLGLWLWNGQWTEITGADAESMMAADVTGDGSEEAAVDFGPKGLWVWNDGAWSKISPLNPEYLLSADTNGDGAKEVLADFGAEGLWLWNGAWTRISEDNPD